MIVYAPANLSASSVQAFIDAFKAYPRAFPHVQKQNDPETYPIPGPFWNNQECLIGNNYCFGAAVEFSVPASDFLLFLCFLCFLPLMLPLSMVPLLPVLPAVEF